MRFLAAAMLLTGGCGSQGKNDQRLEVTERVGPYPAPDAALKEQFAEACEGSKPA